VTGRPSRHEWRDEHWHRGANPGHGSCHEMHQQGYDSYGDQAFAVELVLYYQVQRKEAKLNETNRNSVLS
jgi:hypothetical protein